MRCSVCGKNRDKLINGKCLICINIEMYDKANGIVSTEKEEDSVESTDTSNKQGDTYSFLNTFRRGNTGGND